MTLTSFNIFSADGQGVTDQHISGPNLSASAISSVYGWFVNQLRKLYPDSTTREIVDKYPHPIMCVIGCESTGKSATIENMTKVPLFPTASGICTRCPIKVVLIPIEASTKPVVKAERKAASKGITAAAAARYTLSYRDRPALVFGDDRRDQIKEAVARIFDEIRTNTSLGYDKDEITITIERPDVIRMDFVDLPGIVSYPPEARTFTLDISVKYINDPNSFILCVANATTPRLTSYEPIARIIAANACERSIVVLPMADKLPRRDLGTHLVDRVLQASDELKGLSFSACCAVVNRSEAAEVTLVEQTDIETDWFERVLLSPVRGAVNEKGIKKDEKADRQRKFDILQSRVGIQNLLAVANANYEKYIEHNWMPRTVEEIGKDIKKLEEQQQQLGMVVSAKNLPQFQEAWRNIVAVIASDGAGIWSRCSIDAAIFSAKNAADLNSMDLENVWSAVMQSITAPDKWNVQTIASLCSQQYQIHVNTAPLCLQRFPKLLRTLQQLLVDYFQTHVLPLVVKLYPGSILPALLTHGQRGATTPALGESVVAHVVRHITPALTEQCVQLLSSTTLLAEDTETAEKRKALEKDIQLHTQVMGKLQARISGAKA